MRPKQERKVRVEQLAEAWATKALESYSEARNLVGGEEAAELVLKEDFDKFCLSEKINKPQDKTLRELILRKGLVLIEQSKVTTKEEP